jgi:hypothetical protein
VSPVTVTATVIRNSRGYFKDVVIVEIGGIAFETQANSPEHAREIMERTLKELNLWQE